jgi:hypothetical protein
MVAGTVIGAAEYTTQQKRNGRVLRCSIIARA